MGNCQNYGPFWGPYYNTGPNTGLNLGDPKRDHDFDNPPHVFVRSTPHVRQGNGPCFALPKVRKDSTLGGPPTQ